MSFIYFLIIIFVVWYIVKAIKENKEAEKPQNKVADLEAQAEYFWDILKKDKKDTVWENRPPNWMLRHIERVDDWYVRIKEKDKHNPEKQLQHAKDWFDYVYGSWEFRNHRTQESLGAYDEQDVNETVRESRKLSLPLYEIEKRFAEQLGVDMKEVEKEDERWSEIDDKNWDKEYAEYNKELEKKFPKKKKS